MRACLTLLAVIAAEASMTVAMLHATSAYSAHLGATPSPASARVVTLDETDLQRAASLYLLVP